MLLSFNSWSVLYWMWPAPSVPHPVFCQIPVMDPAEAAAHLWEYGPDVAGEQHAAAPWFHPATVADDELLDVYTRKVHLPGGFSRTQVASWDWQVRCAVPLSAFKSL